MRQFGISHRQMPSYGAHKGFVLANPYRGWFFVVCDEKAVGSIYLPDSNHMGVNLVSGYAHCVEPALRLLSDLYEPLPMIPSVRSGQFSINLAPEDGAQIAALQSAGASLIQWTYQLPGGIGEV